MSEGIVYVKDNNGTREVVVKDTNGRTTAMSAFSGYMAFSGNLIQQGLENAGEIIKGSLAGRVYSVADGIITGVFDAKGNPDKNMNDVIGTSATAILIGESGSYIGGVIGSAFGPAGTAVGAVIGGIVGENAYGNIIDAANKAMDLADQAADFIGGLFGDSEDDEPKFLDHAATIPDNLSNPFGNLIKYDPLALDLDNDGQISIIPQQESSVYFDHDADNIAFGSSWIAPNDGLLVFDKNNNGTIDNGNELFGNFTLNSNGELANNGYEALAQLDSDKNGIIDSNDTEFENLKVWIDENSDGISQENELKSLNELGIESLNLNKFTNLNLLIA